VADDYDFPPDLLDLQRRFFAAETAMKQAADENRDEDMHRHLADAREAAVALNRHTWLNRQPNRFAAHLALRKAAGG
jgi:hypothetical protein